MTVCRLILSGLCAFGGFSAFISFIVLKNYPSACLSCLMGVIESVITFLHFLYIKGRISEWYSPRELRQICRFGITLLFVGIILTIYYTTMEALTKKPIMPIDTSLVLPLIWSVIIIRSAIILIYYSIKYKNVSEYQPVPGNDEEEGSINNESTEIQENQVIQSLPKIDEESLAPSESQSEPQINFEKEPPILINETHTESVDKNEENLSENQLTSTDKKLTVKSTENKETLSESHPTLIEKKLSQEEISEISSETEIKEIETRNIEKENVTEAQHQHSVIAKADPKKSAKEGDISEDRDILRKYEEAQNTSENESAKIEEQISKYTENLVDT